MRIINFDRFFPGAVGSGVTGFVANRYFTEALSERNYSKVEFFRGRFPRVFGDEFGEEFGDKFGDGFSESPNLVTKLVTNLVMNLVNHHIL